MTSPASKTAVTLRNVAMVFLSERKRALETAEAESKNIAIAGKKDTIPFSPTAEKESTKDVTAE